MPIRHTTDDILANVSSRIYKYFIKFFKVKISTDESLYNMN